MPVPSAKVSEARALAGRGRAGGVGVGGFSKLVGEREQVLAAGIVRVGGRLVAGSVIELIRPWAL